MREKCKRRVKEATSDEESKQQKRDSGREPKANNI